MARLFDVFPFYNELALLELRLRELWDVVDAFWIAEAPVTHSGKKKPLFFKENRQYFKAYWSKIRYLCVDDMPVTKKEIAAAITDRDRTWMESGYQVEDSWVRERFQRNALKEAVLGTYIFPRATSDDIIIIEDADEFVRPDVLRLMDSTMSEGVNAIGQTLHTFYLNWKCVNMPWWGSKVIRVKDIGDQTFSEIRFHTPATKYYYDSGWHISYLGGEAAIQEKLGAFAHTEFDTPKVLDNVGNLLRDKKDALGRQYQYQIVPIDETYPKTIQENPEMFAQYMYKVS